MTPLTHCPICQLTPTGLASGTLHWAMLAHIFRAHAARPYPSYGTPVPICPCGHATTVPDLIIDELHVHLLSVPDVTQHLQEAAIVRAAMGLPVTVPVE